MLRSISRLRRQSPVTVKLVLSGFAATIVATAIVSYLNAARLREDGDWITHTVTVQASIERVVSDLKDAETGQRGFVITGDARYLEPYHDATERLMRDYAALDALVADNTEQQQRVAGLKPLIYERLGEIAGVLELYRMSGFEAARARIVSGRGKMAMDQIRAEAQKAIHLEDTLLLQRRRSIEHSVDIARASTFATALAGLGMTGWAAVIYRRERRTSDAALRTLATDKERFRTTLSSIGDGVIVTDSGGRVEFLNKVACELTGWGAEAIGERIETIFKIVNETTRQAVLQPVEDVLRRGIIVGLANHTVLIGKDRSETPIEDSAAPIRDSQGAVAGVVLVFRDASAARHARQMLERSAAELRLADERKDRFLATLAHELRNPLTPLRISARLLKLSTSASPDSREHRAVESIERQCAMLSALIDDLMDLTAIRNAKVTLRREPVDLRAVVDRACEMSAAQIEAKAQALTVHCGDAPAMVTGDEGRLVQVLGNLINNASKYTPQGGAIAVTLEDAGQALTIRVHDNGAGIDPALLPYVFDMFMQAPHTVSWTQGGLGIGLALVRQLVALHGGQVEAFSLGLGAGSEFVVSLPKA